jgi:putative transposase
MAAFRNIYTALMLVIAGSTQKQLARQVAYLKAENQLLRSRITQRIILTHREKCRLVRFAKHLGASLNELASIAHPASIRRWIRQLAQRPVKPTMGRPRTSKEIEQLILKMAAKNAWGYTRILGELKKLNINTLTRNTVKNILKRNGYETGPRRGPGTWDEFIKRHAKTMWQCDFFAKRIVSNTCLRDAYILIFINVATRKVFITPSTYKPGDETWLVEQADAFQRYVKDEGMECNLLMHDRDSKFCKSFDAKFSSDSSAVKRCEFKSPNTNAFVERFIQSIQQECLDHFIAFGRNHFDYLCQEYVEHYHNERPHQGLNNELVIKPPDEELADIPNELKCNERLGGVLRSYSSRAA